MDQLVAKSSEAAIKASGTHWTLEKQTHTQSRSAVVNPSLLYVDAGLEHSSHVLDVEGTVASNLVFEAERKAGQSGNERNRPTETSCR